MECLPEFTRLARERACLAIWHNHFARGIHYSRVKLLSDSARYSVEILRSCAQTFARVPGLRLRYLATQNITHTMLAPNMDSSSLLVTTDNKQDLVKWEPRQT